MSAPLIESLEKLRGTPRDGALLRYSLGLEYLKANDRSRAIAELREAVARDARYSAAWKVLGRALAEDGRADEALDLGERDEAITLTDAAAIDAMAAFGEQRRCKPRQHRSRPEHDPGDAMWFDEGRLDCMRRQYRRISTRSD